MIIPERSTRRSNSSGNATRTLATKDSQESAFCHCSRRAELGRSAATRRRLFIKRGMVRTSPG
eukprot:2102426-Alexandrium_andersonii.AAC.1